MMYDIAARLNVVADMIIQQFSIKPDSRKFCKKVKQYHCSKF